MKISTIIRRAFAYTWLMIPALLCHGCFTISYSTLGGDPPGDTYSVQFVENQANIVEPGLSQQVTNALKDYIESNSKLKMVTGTGDNDFEAVIVGYEPSTPATVSAGDEATQNRFSISIKVRYSCNVNPDLDFESTFTRYTLYSVDANFESEKSKMTEDILELILEDIYKRAFVNW